jgi:hypothetical protein
MHSLMTHYCLVMINKKYKWMNSKVVPLWCKLKKALYGLKQAPRAWYSRLDKYLQQAGFRKGSADNNLYIKVSQGNILLIEVYVDDIIVD